MANRRARLLRRLEEGLYSSVSGNTQAFGFSITVTVCFGVASRLQEGGEGFDFLGFHHRWVVPGRCTARAA
ncbi:MAG: hypothetical protein ACR2LX_10365 [Jatrophihabitans sp.]